MSRRSAGISFCFIATILFCTRYIAAAIFGSGVSSWDANLFSHMLSYMGFMPLALSVISLVVGISYLVVAERDKDKNKNV